MFKRSSRILLEGLAGLIGIGAILAALVFVRLASAPLEMDDLASFVAKQFSDPSRGIAATVNRSALIWDKENLEARLSLDGLVMKNDKDEVIVTVPHAEARVRAWPLLIGRVAFKFVRANGANINLERTESGQLALLGVKPQTPSKTKPEHALSAMLAEWPQRVARIQSQLEQIGDLSITASRLTILDRATGNSIEGNMPSLTVKADDEGIVRGDGSLSLNTEPTPIDMDLNMRLYPESGTGETIISFKGVNPTSIAKLDTNYATLLAMDMPVDGHVNVTYMPNDIMQVTLDAKSTAAGRIFVPNAPEPVAVDSIAANISAVMSGDAGIISGVINTIMFKRGPGSIDVTGAFGGGSDGDVRDLTLSAVIENMPMNDVQALWPVTAAKNARDWVVPNMRDGRIAKATFDLTGSVEWPSLDDFKISDIGGTIALENMLVDYYSPMPPLTQASADAIYDAKGFHITMKGGRVGSVSLKEGGIVDITGLNEDVQNIAVDIAASGPLPDVLEIVNSKPFEYLNKMDMKPKDMQGNAEFNLHIALPLLLAVKMEEIDLKVDAVIHQFANSTLVPAFKLTDGALKAVVDAKQMHVTGPVNANGARVKVDWREEFSPAAGKPASLGKVDVALTEEAINEMGTTFPGTISGVIPSVVTYRRFSDRPDQLTLNADLTPVDLDMPRFGYKKAKGEKGKIVANAEINEGVISMPELSATGPGLQINGSAKLEKDGAVSLMKLSTVKIGQSDIQVDYNGTGALPKISIKGKQMNIGALIEGDEEAPPEEEAEPQLYDVTVDVNRAIFAVEDPASGKKEKYFTPFKLNAVHNADGWMRIDLNALASGTTPLIVKLEPTANGQTLHAESPDLGRVMHALDWTDDILGGRMTVAGSSEGVGKPVKADIAVYDYRVLDLPFMARLLNTLSLDGLLALAQSEKGLEFKRLKGDLIMNGDELRFKNLRTSGGSLGLTAEGTINTATNQINMNGTVVPFSSANKVLGAIPIFGSLLTGGEGGGLFAATYSAKGNIANPDFSTNPLSVLAPGFLRNIFFVDGDD